MVTSEGMCIPRVYNASQEPELASHDLASMTCNVETPCEQAHCSKLGESQPLGACRPSDDFGRLLVYLG